MIIMQALEFLTVFFNPARLIISILHSISKIMIIREKLPVGKQISAVDTTFYGHMGHY